MCFFNTINIIFYRIQAFLQRCARTQTPCTDRPTIVRLTWGLAIDPARGSSSGWTTPSPQSVDAIRSGFPFRACESQCVSHDSTTDRAPTENRYRCKIGFTRLNRKCNYLMLLFLTLLEFASIVQLPDECHVLATSFSFLEIVDKEWHD